MFGNSGPEGSDHDGEDGHHEDDDEAGVEPLLVLAGIRRVNEELAFRIILDEFEQEVSVDRVEESRHRDREIRLLVVVLLHRQRVVQQKPGAVAFLF